MSKYPVLHVAGPRAALLTAQQVTFVVAQSLPEKESPYVARLNASSVDTHLALAQSFPYILKCQGIMSDQY